MRAYMSVPCDIYFTLEAKTDRLITTMLRIYDIGDEKICQVNEFIKRIDFKIVAEKAVEKVFEELAIKNNNPRKEKNQ